jgi:Fe-S-cluster containining protein
MSNQLSKHFKAFYSDGFKIGMNVVEQSFTRESILAATRELYQNIDGLIEPLLGFAEKQGSPAQCAKGCAWCCYQPVYALTNEVLFLHEFVESKFDEQKKAEIYRKADEKNILLKGLPKEVLQNAKHPCPLLTDGACSAYEARPMACRIYLSMSVGSCKNFYSDPSNPSSIPELMDFPLKAGRMMNEGFKAALKQLGRISEEFRIEEGLLRFRELGIEH